MSKGFGESRQALSTKGKSKKAKNLEHYELFHVGQDGCLRVLSLKATSLAEARRKFAIFLGCLTLCLEGANDEEILQFIEENPL